VRYFSVQTNQLLKQLLLLFFVLSIATLTFTQTTGSSTFQSLNTPTSARIIGLGGNQIAVADGDLGLAFFNPALLDSAMDKRLEMSYVNYFSDINFGSAHFAKHYKKLGTASLAVQYVDFGQFDETDVFGNRLGEFSASDVIINLGLGRQLDSNFTAGVNLKYINSTLAEFSSSGIAVDAGIHYYKKKSLFSAALLFKNIGTQFSSYTAETSEDLPFEIQFGITKKLRHAPFRFGFMLENLQKWDIRRESEKDIVFVDPLTGEITEDDSFVQGDIFLRHLVFNTEVLISDNFQLRLGYNYRRRQELSLESKPGTVGLSIGASIKVSKFHISYGRANFHQAGSTNNFTINTSIADW